MGPSRETRRVGVISTHLQMDTLKPPNSGSHSTSFFFFFWPLGLACGILVPQPGIEPRPPAVEVWSPNHWTAREVPGLFLTDDAACREDVSGVFRWICIYIYIYIYIYVYILACSLFPSSCVKATSALCREKGQVDKDGNVQSLL